MELNLQFPEIDRVAIKFDEDGRDESIEFVSPVEEADLKDIQWYLETYATLYTADVDDTRAKGIEAKLKDWGIALFEAVFKTRARGRIFNDFQEDEEEGKLLTISAKHPAILSLPWELLGDPEGTFLVHDNPRISVRRRFIKTGGGRRPFKVQPKESLRLLFVISRPSDAGFINPRLEAQAVMDAILQEAVGRIEVEFLRPATLDALVERLEDDRLPAVDIIHFDGHGAFDTDGRLHERAKLTNPGLTKDGEVGGGGINTGYLVFEDQEGKSAPITAETLGDMLNRQKVGLMVLSACQSATVAGEDALGSVAARLNHAGIPSVLAMSYSVLVTTSRQLFAKFYQRLARGEAIGTALDSARRDLYLNKERGERQRGQERIILKLQDWFLPALYQAGKDTPLLTRTRTPTPQPQPQPHNLPPLKEAGFFGRSRELWWIERAFIQGTRRISISGFGGQGKTTLAIEAAYWLCRTGLFERACFMSYSNYSGADPVGYFLRNVLKDITGQNCFDIETATQAIAAQPTLIILDNLETLQPRAIQHLLTVAKTCSETGKTRLLLTSRTPDFNHPDYATAGSLKHLSLPLKGLGTEKYPDDAIAYFQQLMKLPPAPQLPQPKRNTLVNLFKLVNFHPLSIQLLAHKLKTRRPAELGQRLEALISQTDNPLIASLNLSLERLDAEAQKLLPRLGVFQGGAMEDILLIVTEFSEHQWHNLRQVLEITGLIQAESLLGVKVPYIKFHPILAPVLWEKLTKTPQSNSTSSLNPPNLGDFESGSPQNWRTRGAASDSTELVETLIDRYCKRYYQLAEYLYDEDIKNPQPVRLVALQELPNLLSAVRRSLAAATDYGVKFVTFINLFLYVFRLQADMAQLTHQAEQLAQPGSENWFLAQSNKGEQLWNAGCYTEAQQVFEKILAELGTESSEKRCLTLARLGRCFGSQGQANLAINCYQQGLAVTQQLKLSNQIKSIMGTLQADLTNVLMNQGKFEAASNACKASLTIDKELSNVRGEAIVNIQLGILELSQDNLAAVEKRYQAALKIFQELNEPTSEANVWYNLGNLYQQAQQWQAAELAYRQAAQIEESQGNLAGAANTWGQLALTNEDAGKLETAEGLYRKAIAGSKEARNPVDEARALNNLASFLHTQPNCLTEAQQLAETALVMKQTLDPSVAELWTTYGLLGAIAEKQGDINPARDYRRQAREAKAAYAGTLYELKQHAELIVDVLTLHGIYPRGF